MCRDDTLLEMFAILSFISVYFFAKLYFLYQIAKEFLYSLCEMCYPFIEVIAQAESLYHL